ncbi:MAG: acetate--CoA ligase family protein [Deltaproteobacteria bacterium]|nr:acetate--CoA ligase family protein [Deltaproteobacteria bacterium]MBW1932560.1 acetate--CoA ligase family protein [Deltaproteobacteria bacterium]MBW1937496.1 acetate--CoA ligase family protein [Deltaproteobacteria bacterium]MBW1964830.1 acetate--CoA ligase family protein [Deltaproteobacteria bacterium]MBW2079875.1 acetate--CoA ligase family protein [Deltaproteobacteria bacterium]
MLEALLYPKNVAVIGASRTPGKVGYEIVANLINGGFAGDIIPVNPSADQIVGLKCYKTLKDYKGTVDLGVVTVPRQNVMAAVQSSIEAGVKAFAVITAGFRETGEKGTKLEQELAGLCRSHNVRLLGPNCLGVMNRQHQMNASFAGDMPEAGGISVFSQSGALCTAIVDSSVTGHFGLAKLISLGNKADLTEVDFLRALARDDDTKVIVGYLEDIVSGDEFVKAAEDASSIKPVVILKAGTTPAGLKAASSHTGGLAGVDTAYGAAFRRSGVIRADNFQALFDYASALAMQPLPKGDRVLIITNAGGPGTMAADAVEKSGMTVAALAYSTAAALKGKLPRASSTGNPVDVLGDADPERYAIALSTAQDDDSVDAIIVILTPQAMTKPAETARAIADCIRSDKPVIAAFMGGKHVMPGNEELIAAGLPVYNSPERAVGALKAMYEYSVWRRRPPRIVTRFRVHRRRVERIIARHLRTKRTHVGDIKAKQILSAYGFRIPEGHLANTTEEALEAAEQIGYPVAIKIVSPNIIHKTDLGGVKLHLSTANDVRDAFDLMMLRMGQVAPEAHIEGIYVEKMLARGMEVIIGMSRDPQFGPMLMFGLGGIFVEVMKDVTFHLAPITTEEAFQMLKSTRSYEMLKGTRGERGVDFAAIANGLQRISQLVTDYPEIIELDINPFIVGDIGTEPFVADARMTLTHQETQ